MQYRTGRIFKSSHSTWSIDSTILFNDEIHVSSHDVCQLILLYASLQLIYYCDNAIVIGIDTKSSAISRKRERTFRISTFSLDLLCTGATKGYDGKTTL